MRSELSREMDAEKEMEKMRNLSDCAEELGIKKGIEETTVRTVTRMLEEGMSDSLILRIAEITPQRLREIKDAVSVTA